MKPSIEITPPKARGPRSLLLLVMAIAIITIANMARIVDFYQYMQLNKAPVTDWDEPCIKMTESHIAPGYFRQDACFSRVQVLTIIKELVFTVADTFDAHNLTYFLDSGTLLGAFRNHSVIPHDVDADVGVDAAALAYLQTQPMEFPPQYALTVWNSSLYPNSYRDKELPARLIHKDSGLYVDVFAYLDWRDPDTGAAMVGPHPSWCFGNCVGCKSMGDIGKFNQVPREWIYPVVDCPFEGRTTIKCPRETKQYLRHMFGKFFMTPVRDGKNY